MKRSAIIRTAIVVGVIVLAEFACRWGLISRHTLVPPSEMVIRLVALMQHDEFWTQVVFTASNIVIAFAAGTLGGFVIGVILHRSPRARRALEPMIASYYALPFFVLYPLFIVLFGMNAVPIICMGFLYSVMAMITGTLTGLDRVPRVFVKVGQTCRLGPIQEAWYIQLPAAAPYIFTGAKLALGYSITGVIGSEFILSTHGVGYAIAFAYNDFDDSTMYALLVFVFAAVSVLTLILHAAEQRVQYRARSGATERSPGVIKFFDRMIGIAIVALVIFIVWQLLYDKVGREALASPAMAFTKIGVLFSRPEFWSNVAETMRALGLSLGLSCVAGALIGVVLGLHKPTKAVLEPLLIAFYAMPKVTLYPMILLFFGIGLSAKVAFGAIYGMIPMILITLNAIASMNPSLRRTGQVMRLNRTQMLTTIILPATVPEMVSGVRISFSITLLGVMIGEMFASQRGLGFMIMNSMGVNDTPTMMAVTVLIGLFALTINGALMVLDARFHRN
jgi:ABC-type nitrate/sulfonate/bicarbonate transport system permease component